MFDGVPHEQLHQFIVSRAPPPNSSSSSLPLPFSSFPTFPFSNSSPTFEPNNFNPHQNQHLQQLLAPQFLHHPIILHQSPSENLNINHEEEIKEAAAAGAAEPITNNLVSSSSAATINCLEIERDINITVDHPWSNDEVLTLLRIRSAVETWFPDFTWEHISRKLSEFGFKRSAEKCKEKFEEESRYFSNNINNCTTKSYRFLSRDELEVELYNHIQEENPVLVPPPPPHQNNNNKINNIGTQINSQNMRSVVLEENPSSHELAAGQKDHEKGATTSGTSADHDHQDDVRNIDDDDDQALNGRSRIIRKRPKRNEKIKFEMFKGFCEEIVNKMMTQQEEMHNKLLEDMVKREKEKVEKEEAWKKQEMDRMNKELEMMAHEQAIAGDRQATIIDFLNKFISSSSWGTPVTANTNSSSSDYHDYDYDHHHHQIISQFSSRPENAKFSLTSSSSNLIQAAHDQSPNHGPNNVNIVEEEAPPPPPSSAMIVRRQNSTSLSSHDDQNNNTMIITESLVISDHQQYQNPQKVLTSSNPSSLKVTTQNPRSSSSVQNDMKEDVGKRWPRDEVLALINLRCSLYNGDHNNINQDHKEGGGNNSVVRAPLWERISQGMSELGYKRSAKRCKEKWENINKYFRKTKDVDKKRSVDSRTCPYFHQLSTLYNKGTLVSPSDQGQEIDHHHHSSLGSLADDHNNHDHHNSSVHAADPGERSSANNVVVHHHHHHHQEVVVPSAFDFEF